MLTRCGAQASRSVLSVCPRYTHFSEVLLQTVLFLHLVNFSAFEAEVGQEARKDKPVDGTSPAPEEEPFTSSGQRCNLSEWGWKKCTKGS